MCKILRKTILIYTIQYNTCADNNFLVSQRFQISRMRKEIYKCTWIYLFITFQSTETLNFYLYNKFNNFKNMHYVAKSSQFQSSIHIMQDYLTWKLEVTAAISGNQSCFLHYLNRKSTPRRLGVTILLRTRVNGKGRIIFLFHELPFFLRHRPCEEGSVPW